jgi:uncharacterized protein (TIGR03382 family)
MLSIAPAVAAVAASTWMGQARAFFPHAWLSGYGAVGKSHETITSDAIKQVLSQVYSIQKPSRTVSLAIDKVVEGNAYVDKNQVDGFWHFDGEAFNKGQQQIQTMKEWLISSLRVDRIEEARYNLGRALHTLQDFYSHSNWVDLDNTGAHPLVGRYMPLPDPAFPSENTCGVCKTPDNCPNVGNPDQADTDKDKSGDACDTTATKDVPDNGCNTAPGLAGGSGWLGLGLAAMGLRLRRRRAA